MSIPPRPPKVPKDSYSIYLPNAVVEVMDAVAKRHGWLTPKGKPNRSDLITSILIDWISRHPEEAKDAKAVALLKRWEKMSED